MSAEAMNDLAEKALHYLDATRRGILARPVLSLAVLGFVVAAVTVFVGGRVGAAPDALPPTRWLGLLPPDGFTVQGPLLGVVLIAAIVALAVLWLVALRVVHSRRIGDRAVWTLAGVWALPFVIGPPLLSTDVYSDVAHGLLARAGRDPYTHPPAALGNVSLIDAIDPGLRSTTSTGGPLSTLTEHLAVAASGGHVLGAVLLLRALAVAAAVAIGRLAVELAGPRHAGALAMTVLNPALLLYVVSGAHLEGLLGALLLGSFVAAGQRRWLIAVVLAALAAGVKPVALVAVPAVIAAHAVGHRARTAWRLTARDTALAAATLAVAVLIVPDGLGWAGNLSAVTHQHTPFTPASVVSDLIARIVPSASFDDLAVGGRIAAALAALTVVVFLLVTVRDRPLDRTVGFALLAIGILAPVLRPWYLLWGLLCLAPTATRARRDWVVALSVAACLLEPVGFTDREADVVTMCGLGVVACALVVRLLVRGREAVVTDLPAGVSAGGPRSERRAPARW